MVGPDLCHDIFEEKCQQKNENPAHWNLIRDFNFGYPKVMSARTSIVYVEVANWRPLPLLLLIASAIPSTALRVARSQTRIRYIYICSIVGYYRR
mgnify:CR=1 FL=1